MSFNRYKAAFDRDGFVIVPQLLAPDEFAELRTNLDRYIREVVPTLPDSDAFYLDRSRPETLKQMQHMGKDSYFGTYTRHPIWTSCARGLLGEEAEVQEPEWFNKPPASN